MPIDASIPLSYRAPQIKSPAEIAQERFMLKQLNAQNQQMEQQDAMRQELITLGDLSDPEKVAQVVSKYDPMKGQEIRQNAAKLRLDQQESAVKLEGSKLNNAKAVYDLVKTSSSSVLANPTLQNALFETQRFGKMTGQDVSGEIANLESIGDNPDALRKWAAGHALSADQLLPKIQHLDTGGQILNQAVDPLTGMATNTGTVAKTNSPDAILTDVRSREEAEKGRQFQRIMEKERQGFQLTQQERQFAQAWKMQANQQGFTAAQQNRSQQFQSTLKDKELAAKMPPAQQKVVDATDVLAILDQAEPLLETSTGSGIGAAYDTAERFLGGSNRGAQDAAKLQALEGLLVSKMPKMSGPQSDKDVLLYKQMAGQIGDPSVPAAQKRAAIDAIRQINSRYAGVPYQPKAEAKPKTSFNAMPNPSQYAGKSIRDTASGILYKSDGKNWVKQ